MVRSAQLPPVLFGQATLMYGVTNRRLGIRQSAKALRQAPSRHLRIHRGSPNDLRVYFIPIPSLIFGLNHPTGFLPPTWFIPPYRVDEA